MLQNLTRNRSGPEEAVDPKSTEKFGRIQSLGTRSLSHRDSHAVQPSVPFTYSGPERKAIYRRLPGRINKLGLSCFLITSETLEWPLNPDRTAQG